jgi:hypothetical protein
MVPKNKPHILFLDLETSPIIAYTWGPKWETNLIEVIEYTRILSYSAKWLGGVSITKGWPDYKGYKAGVLNDFSIVLDLWKLVDEADIIVAQNGKDFDIRTLNARFAKYDLPPPSPYRVVDTKVEIKKYLRLPSNSLDDIGHYFDIGRKKEHEGFKLWLKCISGDRQAWARMLKYNKQDVVLLERVYFKIRPWVKTHPNISVFVGGCPKCGSKDLQSRGSNHTQGGSYTRFKCNSCLGWSQSKKVGKVEYKSI